MNQRLLNVESILGAKWDCWTCIFSDLFFIYISVFFNITALIIFPIKYDEELRRNGIKEWVFGWAYGLGWGVTVIILISAFLLWLDKDADEIIFREKTSYNNEGIEEVNILWLGIGRNFGIEYRFTKTD